MASQLISELCSNLRGTLGKNRFPSSARVRSVDVCTTVHYGTSQSSKSYLYFFCLLFQQDLAQASTSLKKPKLKIWGLLRNQAELKYVFTQFLFSYLSLTRISALALS